MPRMPKRSAIIDSVSLISFDFLSFINEIPFQYFKKIYLAPSSLQVAIHESHTIY
jgi:hypothetical protein